MVEFNPGFLVLIELVNGKLLREKRASFPLAMLLVRRYRSGTMEAKVLDKNGLVVKFSH